MYVLACASSTCQCKRIDMGLFHYTQLFGFTMQPGDCDLPSCRPACAVRAWSRRLQ